MKKKLDLETLLEKLADNPESRISQADFARVVGLDKSVINRLIKRNILSQRGTWRTWFNQICAYWQGRASALRGSGFFAPER